MALAFDEPQKPRLEYQSVRNIVTRMQIVVAALISAYYRTAKPEIISKHECLRGVPRHSVEIAGADEYWREYARSACLIARY